MDAFIAKWEGVAAAANNSHNQKQRYPVPDHDEDNDSSRKEEILALTCECETGAQVDRLLQALEVAAITLTSYDDGDSDNDNSHHRQQPHRKISAIFRESFFPLRRIRQHLSTHDFLRMIEGIAALATGTIQLAPTLLGMVPGRLASVTIGPRMQHFQAVEAITFATEADVLSMHDSFLDCSDLETLQLVDFYVSRRQAPCLDALLESLWNAADTAATSKVTTLELSVHPEQHYKRKIPLLTAQGLQYLPPCIVTLNLCRLGLKDEEFQSLSDLLSQKGRLSHLKWLCLDGNRPSLAGIQYLRDTLATDSQASTNLEGLSMTETWYAEKIDWSQLFPQNTSLEGIDVDNTEDQTITDLWLEMNRRGRRLWLQDGNRLPKNLWSQLLASNSDSPFILHYLLQNFSESIVDAGSFANKHDI